MNLPTFRVNQMYVIGFSVLPWSASCLVVFQLRKEHVFSLRDKCVSLGAALVKMFLSKATRQTGHCFSNTTEFFLSTLPWIMCSLAQCHAINAERGCERRGCGRALEHAVFCFKDTSAAVFYFNLGLCEVHLNMFEVAQMCFPWSALLSFIMLLLWYKTLMLWFKCLLILRLLFVSLITKLASCYIYA